MVADTNVKANLMKVKDKLYFTHTGSLEMCISKDNLLQNLLPSKLKVRINLTLVVDVN